MADLNLTAERPKINIDITDADGVEHKHQFEVLPLTKPRFDETIRFAKEGAALAENGDTADAAPLMAEFCDKMLRSMNGPVTITSLWEDGVLPFAWVTRIAQHIQREAVGDPPA